MQKYEYKCVTIWNWKEEKTTRILNEYGQQGWELVAVYNTVHYFKRVIEL